MANDVIGPTGFNRIQIVQLGAEALQALARGDLNAANAAAAVPLSAYFVGPDWRNLWRRRSLQVREDSDSAGWITGVIWDATGQLSLGRAGFHGPPDSNGMLEVGYAVDPTFRRRGYARAALVLLLERAARETDVRTVRASVSPSNHASLNLIRQYGFTHVGEQWDDEDGLEIVYETTVETSG